jgi:hypothetical protein
VRGCGRGVDCSYGRRAALSHEVVQLISSPWHGSESESVDKVSVQQAFHVVGQEVRTFKEGSRRLGVSAALPSLREREISDTRVHPV